MEKEQLLNRAEGGDSQVTKRQGTDGPEPHTELRAQGRAEAREQDSGASTTCSDSTRRQRARPGWGAGRPFIYPRTYPEKG